MGDKSQDDRYDYLEYIDQLSEEEAKYAREFYKEYYFDGISDKKKNGVDPIITDPDMKIEARRNHNSMKTDILFRIKKNEEDEIKKMSADYKLFMEDASDEWEWQDAFKQLGYEAALNLIFEQTIKELNNNKIDKKITLQRYYEKREKLRKQLRREKNK